MLFLLNGKSVIWLRLKKSLFGSQWAALRRSRCMNDLSCLSWKICHYPVFFEGTKSIFPETWALSLSRCKKLSCCAQISNRSLKLSWEEDPDSLVMLACLTQRRVIWRRASSQSDNRSVLYLPLLAPLAPPPLLPCSYLCPTEKVQAPLPRVTSHQWPITSQPVEISVSQSVVLLWLDLCRVQEQFFLI